MKPSIYIGILGSFTYLLAICSCTKFVQIPPPKSSITTSEVFADSSDASAAISGIYSSILYENGGIDFCNGSETILCGLSSDELVNFNGGNFTQFYFNALQSSNGNVNYYFWEPAYTYIYQVNACLEGINNSKSLAIGAKTQFTGEAKFFRGLFYFYLVNIFGDVPYVTSSNWQETDTIGRTPKSVIFQNIIGDLKDAKGLLLNDYSYSNNQRVRANKLAAGALLARVYLYLGDWTNAKAEADTVINSNLFSLEPDLNSVFLVNSNESILQWQLNTSYGYYNSTPEGISILPYDSTYAPFYYISTQLLNSFEPGDQRKLKWIDSSNYTGIEYYYPFKYKIGYAQQFPNATATENYTVLRLAEQYLIRAEAKAELGSDLAGSASDLNLIRNRAGLGNTSASSSLELLNAIATERRVELFAEWGHRWFDLKRTGKIDSVMTIVTPQKSSGSSWQSYQQLYPIPSTEITLNPFLRQNPGYN